MKKNLTAIVLLICGTTIAQRHLDITAGYSTINPTEWNRTISAYNFARPWLNEKQPEINSAFKASIGYSGVIGKGIFISPLVSHQVFNSNSDNGNSTTGIKLRWMSAGIHADIYPMEFGLDSVGFKTRPFVRIGGGASAILPRITINDSLATARDEVYDPIIWTYQFTAGIGCRYSITNKIDLIALVETSYFPNVDLENFRYALHGTQQPDLIDVQTIFNWTFSIGVSFKLGKTDILLD